MKIGVIGTGKMGENHVKTYASLTNECELIGIYDNDYERSKEIALKYNVKQFQLLTDLLKEVDAVSIAVPTKYHFETGLACIQHNVHMLMEKPITSNEEEARILVKKAKEAGIILQLGHIELFNPKINILKQLLVNEKIIAIDIHRMNPYDQRLSNVDVIHDLMIHDLYILHQLLNKEMKKFYAIGHIINQKMRHASVLADFNNGTVAQLTASFMSAEKIRTIRIMTENTFITVNLLNKKIEITKSPHHYIKSLQEHPLEKVCETITFQNYNSLENQLIDFLNCIKNGAPPSVPGEDGIYLLNICNKISNFIKKDFK
ncbi:Gfo/Idh/MocA family oxidoreductase [Metabacillus fastidiosus]|uniref:Gfo/Idh/MocA family oxidoreductase n=1 Tax=Metabacillus fastidiosus TaxID=1458 RepID=A0ABU6P3X9_9BACI|nr:Gfo/Idh/MocA family oxidoreductase [Metabacillus fastidiosus]